MRLRRDSYRPGPDLEEIGAWVAGLIILAVAVFLIVYLTQMGG